MTKKQRNAWRCKNRSCRMMMHKSPAQQAAKIAKTMGRKIMHICGQCKTCHIQEGDGLRLATAGEMFSYRLQVGKLADQIDAATFEATDIPTGTLIFPERQS